jgi:hypothetical protein
LSLLRSVEEPVPPLADANLIHQLLGIPAGTLRQWVNRGKLQAYPPVNGRAQYDYLTVRDKLAPEWRENLAAGVGHVRRAA